MQEHFSGSDFVHIKIVSTITYFDFDCLLVSLYQTVAGKMMAGRGSADDYFATWTRTPKGIERGLQRHLVVQIIRSMRLDQSTRLLVPWCCWSSHFVFIDFLAGDKASMYGEGVCSKASAPRKGIGRHHVTSAPRKGRGRHHVTCWCKCRWFWCRHGWLGSLLWCLEFVAFLVVLPTNTRCNQESLMRPWCLGYIIS